MSNADWWKAKCGDATGLIPSNYGKQNLVWDLLSLFVTASFSVCCILLKLLYVVVKF